MKSCLICLTSGHADDVPTCPFCGEASWCAIESDTAPECKEPKGKRGRKPAADDAVDTTPEGKDK